MCHYAKRWLAVFCMLGALAGCSAADSSKTGSGSDAQQPAADVNAEIMDFSKSLDLKKPAKPVSETPQILFLGNSFLFVNDLPGTFYALSQSGGYNPSYAELSDGGYHLSYFADPQDELGAQFYDICDQYALDYVILQEQSRLPTLEGSVQTEMYPAARTLDQTIKENGAQTVFLMTWAYKNGDDLTEFGIDSVTTRDEMQTQLAKAYMGIAGELDALLCPAGISFIRASTANPAIELWDEDEMHPTMAGTYLAACTLYATVYDASPVGLPYLGELDADTAAALQQIAADTVLGTGA